MVEKLYNRNLTLVRYSGCHPHLVAICIPLILLCIIALSSAVLPQGEDESSKLMELISENEDTLVDVNDLAYFLVIHDFDARPEDDYVEVYLEGAVYKLVPNGSNPGLANITVVDK